jgi:hypothetical protein
MKVAPYCSSFDSRSAPHGYVHIADGGAPQIVVKSVRLSAVMELWQASNASSETRALIVDGWRTRDLRADDQHLRHTQGARGIRGDRLYDSATLWKSNPAGQAKTVRFPGINRLICDRARHAPGSPGLQRVQS